MARTKHGYKNKNKNKQPHVVIRKRLLTPAYRKEPMCVKEGVAWHPTACGGIVKIAPNREMQYIAAKDVPFTVPTESDSDEPDEEFDSE